MRIHVLSFALLALAASTAVAAPGDIWILGIDHTQGSINTYAGGGYSGVQSSGNPSFVGNSYGRTSTDGVARVYWELSGNSVNNGTPVPGTTELYKIEFFGTTDVGHNSWQPVESQFHGAGGETFPIEPSIPWAGQFGTNHQYIAADGADDGLWHGLGPGPQADTSSPADGTMMWLTSGSWLYSKWDFPFDIDRSWSALRVTQVTGVPEPSAIITGGIGLLSVGLFARRRTLAKFSQVK